MTRPRGATASRSRGVVVGLVVMLAAGCASPRIVPVPAAGVQIDAAQGLASVAAGRGRAGGAAVGLAREPLGPARLRDAVPRHAVERRRASRSSTTTRASGSSTTPASSTRRCRPPRSSASFAGAPGARCAWPPPARRRPSCAGGSSPSRTTGGGTGTGGTAGPGTTPGFRPSATSTSARCRWARSSPARGSRASSTSRASGRDARGLTLEFHHRLGELPRVLTLRFEVERDAAGAPGG